MSVRQCNQRSPSLRNTNRSTSVRSNLSADLNRDIQKRYLANSLWSTERQLAGEITCYRGRLAHDRCLCEATAMEGSAGTLADGASVCGTCGL